MQWDLIDDEPASVTAAVAPLPRPPISATRWTNQLAEQAYRRGLEEGRAAGHRSAIGDAVAGATAAATPKSAVAPAARPVPKRAATKRPAPKPAARNLIRWIKD